VKRKTQDNPFIRTYEIVKDNHPTHNDRLWLAGRLLWYHRDDVDRVCDVIAQVNCWDDYDPITTRSQVESVRRSKRSGTRDFFVFSSSRPQGRDLTSVEVNRLAANFDWDAAQQKAFARTSRLNKCMKKDCYTEPDCYLKPCRWVTNPLLPLHRPIFSNFPERL